MKSRAYQASRGFTLIEIVLATLAGSVVFLAIGMSLAMGHRFWFQTFHGVELQRDASYTMQVMTRSIRDASSAQLEAGGTALKIERDGGWVRYQHNISLNRIDCTSENGDDFTVSEDIQLLTFSITADQVGIVLELNRDNKTVRCETTVWMRNTGA